MWLFLLRVKTYEISMWLFFLRVKTYVGVSGKFPFPLLSVRDTLFSIKIVQL